MLEMQISGGQAIARTLDKLGQAEQREFKAAAKKATRAALKPIHQAARAGAPSVSGRLRRAIKLKVWKRPQPGEIGFKVQIDPGTSRDDQRGAYYGALIEGGYIAGNKYIPGRHMLLRAYGNRGRVAQKALSAALAREVDKIIKKG